MTQDNEMTLTPETAYARLQLWYQQKRDLTALKVVEHFERVRLSSFYFTAPREGTNRIDLGGGFDLKLDHSYNYKVDVAALDNVTPAQIKKHKLPWDDLFIYEPKLSVKTYRALTTEQKAFVDALLDIKEGSPQLEIVPRANAEGARQHAIAAAPAAPALAVIAGIDDPDAGVEGDYYEDGDNQWWLCDANGEWEECENPNPAPVTKPARKRKGA